MAVIPQPMPAAADIAVTDPYEREAQIFPRLTPEMAERVASYGSEERLPAGTLVFERGERSVDFFLVLEGTIEIFDLDTEGKPHVITVLGERQFTGELDLFNDGRARSSALLQVSARVRSWWPPSISF